VATLQYDFLTRSVSPTAISGFVVAGVVLIVLGASWMPARQARKLEPAVLLRQE
jgi:ABC-type lipoprotein release transport system permease subunit